MENLKDDKNTDINGELGNKQYENEYHSIHKDDDLLKSGDGIKQGHYKRLFMDNAGNIKSSGKAAALVRTTRVYIILGWVFAALTAFVSPLFALGGIIFGVLANKEAKGSGNALIITNVVIATINMIFGLFLVALVRRMMIGY